MHKSREPNLISIWSSARARDQTNLDTFDMIDLRFECDRQVRTRRDSCSRAPATAANLWPPLLKETVDSAHLEMASGERLQLVIG